MLEAGTGRPGIVDLGTSRAATGRPVLGTPVGLKGPALARLARLAPERLEGGDGPAADTYTLGCILYELITGRPPFAGGTTAALVYQILQTEPRPPTSIDPSLPAGLDAVIARALAEDPNTRYSTARDLGAATRAAAAPPWS